MPELVLLGAGKIGRCIARLLHDCGEYDLTVADADEPALAEVEEYGVGTKRIDVRQESELRQLLAGADAVISALAFRFNPRVASVALDCGCSYFDLTEDVASTYAVTETAHAARDGQIFMPQCGLAPGFISIAGHWLTRGFDRLDSIRLRVGALPLFPTNELKYNLTWSTDGLINEYCNPCWVIHDGEAREVLPLEGLEHFSLDGVNYEAFNTSGGLGTLWETLAGQVRTLDYKTVRYRGHRDLIAFLVNELRLRDRRPLLKEILEGAIPVTLQDVALIFCTVTGWRGDHFTQVTDARKIYHRGIDDQAWSAIQITTAAAVCAAVDLWRQGALPPRGLVRQEQIELPTFLDNRFGALYAGPNSEPILHAPLPAAAEKRR